MGEPGDGRRRVVVGTQLDLAALLLDCLGDGDSGIARHVDLDLGDTDSLSYEASLYTMLGIEDATSVLLGISLLDTGDIEACRVEWGQPLYRVDLREVLPGLCWDFWRVSGLTLAAESVAGAAVILVEADPRWVLLTDASESNPMLFAGPDDCPAHRPGHEFGPPPRAY